MPFVFSPRNLGLGINFNFYNSDNKKTIKYTNAFYLVS